MQSNPLEHYTVQLEWTVLVGNTIFMTKDEVMAVRPKLFFKNKTSMLLFKKKKALRHAQIMGTWQLSGLLAPPG